jgi:hypothetical protein
MKTAKDIAKKMVLVALELYKEVLEDELYERRPKRLDEMIKEINSW